jgi:tetratricopeptide (TPR) repeat protein
MNEPSVLDQQTAAAIRDAMAAVKGGRMADACRIGERALENGGDAIALNAMLGALHSQSGNMAAGVRHLRVAQQSRPDDFVIAANLATALSSLGEFQPALNVASEELAIRDNSLRLARIRGFAAQQLKDYPTAIAAYTSVVEVKPSDWEMWNNLGNTKVSSGDLAGGIEALRRAVALNPEVAPTRLNLCRALRDAGELSEAEAQLRTMAADFPDDAKPLVDLFALLRLRGQDDGEAEELLQQGVERDPGDIDLRIGLARAYAGTHQMEKAEREFRAVLAKNSVNEDAFVGLALTKEHYQPATLEALVGEAAAAGASAPCVSLLQAFADRRAKRYREGLGALASLPPDYEAIHRANLEGQLLDALGEYDAAFASFKRMNTLHFEDESQPLARAEQVRQELRQLLDTVSFEWVRSRSGPAIKSSRPAPVFLVGFPRSGTTLLDTMLMGHPDVEVLEERPVLTRLGREIGGFDALAAMDAAQFRQTQDRYFEIANDYGDVRDGALLVDKGPLALNRAFLIHLLFPDAQFILALRHPVDAVLSCFMSNFRLNSSMCNFLQLETAAEFYDLTFAMWEKSRTILPLNVHEIRYESVVENSEQQLRQLVEALGLEWHADVLEHETTAEVRGIIATASYAQVTQPLYRRAIGRWKHYRKHLEPILSTLQPWAEKLGYDIA